MSNRADWTDQDWKDHWADMRHDVAEDVHAEKMRKLDRRDGIRTAGESDDIEQTEDDPECDIEPLFESAIQLILSARAFYRLGLFKGKVSDIAEAVKYSKEAEAKIYQAHAVISAKEAEVLGL